MLCVAISYILLKKGEKHIQDGVPNQNPKKTSKKEPKKAHGNL